MKSKKLLFSVATACALFGAAVETPAQVIVGVDPAKLTSGYMNVFDLSNNYLWGSSWGVGDLVSTWSPTVLTLAPNTIGDTSSYWYLPSGGPGAVGQKLMEANLYSEQTSSPLSGTTVTFKGTVLANTFTTAHSTVAFIKDFAPDWSSANIATVPLTGPGAFSVTLATDPASGRHVQYGFATKGVNVWATDVGPYGNILIAVPEPSILALAGLGMATLVTLRRRK